MTPTQFENDKSNEMKQRYIHNDEHDHDLTRHNSVNLDNDSNIDYRKLVPSNSEHEPILPMITVKSTNILASKKMDQFKGDRMKYLDNKFIEKLHRYKDSAKQRQS